MCELAYLSILFVRDEGISHIFSGHIRLFVKSEVITPNFILPRELAVIYSCQAIRQLFLHCLAHLLDRKIAIAQPPKALANIGIFCSPLVTEVVLSSLVPFRRERLRDFDSFIFIHTHVQPSQKPSGTLSRLQ